jgi:AraC-like DNA-binding protein
MTDSAVQRFSTAEVPVGSRVPMWNAFGSETMCSLSVDPAGPEPFEASLCRTMVGNIGVGWMRTTAATCNGDSGRVGPWSAPMADAFLLRIQENGTSRVRHLGREFTCQAGEMIFIDATQPWQTSCCARMNLTMLKLPVERVLSLVPRPEAACGVRLGGKGPASLATSLLLSIKHGIECYPQGGWEQSYESILLDIVAVILRGAIEPEDSSIKGVNVRREACVFIERCLDDPDLSVAAIAKALGTSIRSIQRSFVEVGQTPSRYILDRRLAAAAERLKRSGDGGSRISDVAYSVGFSDLSYFTRAFRKKIGVSPREYKRGHSGRAGGDLNVLSGDLSDTGDYPSAIR